MNGIIPMVVDKFDPTGKRYLLEMINADSNYCGARDKDDLNLIFHFKLDNVRIVYERVA